MAYGLIKNKEARDRFNSENAIKNPFSQQTALPQQAKAKVKPIPLLNNNQSIGMTDNDTVPAINE